MGERTHYEPGTFCWVGLATSSPVAAEQFYTSVLDWEAEELSAGEAGAYTMLRRDAQDVAILYRLQPEARAAAAPPHWTSYISVEDADATAARAGELGGAAVFREPFDVLDAGRVAAIGDPTGAVVSLWQPRSRIGATLVNDVGALCWNELATTDVERAKAFFGALLGWQYEMDDSGYASIRIGGRLNGGIRAQTERERDSTELAPVLHGQEQRRGRPPRGARGRAHGSAGERDSHRPHRRHRRPTGSRVRGLRG